MAFFENIPSWAQAINQTQNFNPAPMILNPYQHGMTGMPLAPPTPQPMQQQGDQSSGVSSTPVPLGTQLQSLANPSAQPTTQGANNWISPVMQLLQQMHGGAQVGDQFLKNINVTPQILGGNNGGLFGLLGSLFGG